MSLEESFFHGWKEEIYPTRRLGSRSAAQQRENKLKADWNEMTNSPKGKPDTGPGLQDIATSEDDYIGDRPNQTSYANDAPVIGRYLLRAGL
jgi:hypothetical protein